VLGAQDAGQCFVDGLERDGAAGRDELPREVGELLRSVRVAARRGQEPVEGLVRDRLAALLEPLRDEALELDRRDHPDLDLLRAAPELLVLVLEDALEQVPLAAQVDVADLGLGLEDRAHQVREALVEGEDLLELVEDDHDAALALGRELAELLEELLDRLVEVAFAAAGAEGEAEGAVARVDLDRRADAEVAEELGGLLERVADGRRDVRVDGLGERGREALLRRGLHEVDVADEELLGERRLGRLQDERRLAVAAGRVDEDVLTIAHVREQLGHLVLAIGEGLVEREVAEGEWIRPVLIHQ